MHPPSRRDSPSIAGPLLTAGGETPTNMDSSSSNKYDDLARRAEARAPDERMRDSVLRTASRFAPLGFVVVVVVIVVAVVGRRMPSDDDASTTADV